MAKLVKAVSQTVSTKSCGTKPCNPKPCDKTVDFKFYAPQAKKVFIGGGFNDWRPEKHPMKKDKKGNWTTTLKLLPGRYEYRYLVDGVWQNAQEPVECVPNALGSWNCIAEVA